MKYFSTGLTALLISLPLCAAVDTNSPAPDFTLNAQSGKPVEFTQFKGQVVMLNFWASWCGPCRQEMPLLDSIYKKYGKLGVNVEPDSKAANDWLKQTPVTFPILYDTDSKVSKLYGVSGMPSTVIVDRKGTVRMIHRGYKPGDEEEYLSSIRSLMRE